MLKKIAVFITAFGLVMFICGSAGAASDQTNQGSSLASPISMELFAWLTEPSDSAEANETAPQENVPDVRIEVNIPATEMTVYENGVPVFVKPVAIGSGVYPTPEQESEMKKIEWNPWWYPPPDAKWAKGAKPTPPGPGNPLGRVKMPISDAILFHGTNKENTVGRPASHGCMRMFNADASEVGWYLQSKLSDKSDPKLRETYTKNSRTTYVVKLVMPVPVKLVYKPIVVRDNSLILYPDYYNRLGSKKKAMIMETLIKNGIAPNIIDETKINELTKKWPSHVTQVPIESLKQGPAT